MARGTQFSEAMAGTWRRAGERDDRAFRFDVTAETPTRLRPLGTVVGKLVGTVDAAGLATAAPATGSIEVSPVQHRRIRYTLEFTGDDGGTYTFDGWKSIEWLRPLETWTTLPGSIYDANGEVVGEALTRFPMKATPSLLASFRMRPAAKEVDVALDVRRWDGTPDRAEVWYDTFTDPATGTGFWLHHELVAPADGGDAFVHGWAAVFPPDGEPAWERFGPVADAGGDWFRAGDVIVEPGVRRGSTATMSWDLRYADQAPPLFTFPRATWRREVLPGAQIVPSPTAEFDGTFRVGEREWTLSGARGAAARIYGHGSAKRWAWLHADLGGGDVLEIVAAVSRRPGLDRLPPLPMVQLRVGGEDWPPNPLVAGVRLKARLGLPTWTVEGTWRGRALRVEVTQPPERCVRIPYTDPDGATATCTNTERADVHVVFGDREWRLEGTAHAEVGTRP